MAVQTLRTGKTEMLSDWRKEGHSMPARMPLLISEFPLPPQKDAADELHQRYKHFLLVAESVS
jgi:hypothetical protein